MQLKFFILNKKKKYMENNNEDAIRKNDFSKLMENKLIKKKYFVNISLLEYENIFLSNIVNISPFFEVEVIKIFISN